MAWQPVDFLQNLLAPVSDEEDTEEEEASEEEVLAFFFVFDEIDTTRQRLKRWRSQHL